MKSSREGTYFLGSKSSAFERLDEFPGRQGEFFIITSVLFVGYASLFFVESVLFRKNSSVLGF